MAKTETKPEAQAASPEAAKLVLTHPSRVAGKIHPPGTFIAEIRVTAGTLADIDKAILNGRARVAL